MHRHMALAAVCALSITGCSDQGTDPAEQASPDPELVRSGASPAAPLSPAQSSPPPSPTTTEGMGKEFPRALQGRWGLVPADCTSTRGDAKGLVTIGPRDMRFYESVATLKSASAAGPAQLRGSFAYSGEGMEWSRDVALAVQDGGKVLVMEEFGDDAPPGPRTYSRCD